MLILASRSPRRAALLRAAGLDFRVAAPPEEDAPPPQSARPAALAKAMALRKATAVAAGPADIVLGADTLVVCEGQILGKPAREAGARRMLRVLSGKQHFVYTGVALVVGTRRLLGCERTAVRFRPLTAADISRYLATGEPMDKAGAYAIQGHGGALIADIRGCYTNVVGLPLPKVLSMLAELGEASR